MMNVRTFRPIYTPWMGQPAAPIPSKPNPPAGVPPIVVNTGIMAVGLAMGLAAFPVHKKPVGALLFATGGGMIALGTVFLILDLIGATSP